MHPNTAHNPNTAAMAMIYVKYSDTHPGVLLDKGGNKLFVEVDADEPLAKYKLNEYDIYELNFGTSI